MTSWLFIALVLFAVFAVGFRLGQRREQGKMVLCGAALRRMASLYGLAPLPGESDRQLRARIRGLYTQWSGLKHPGDSQR